MLGIRFQRRRAKNSSRLRLHSFGGAGWRSYPPICRAEVRAALERVGFIFRRQKSSHMILRRDNPYARVTIPDHKQVRIGTLRRIVADAGLSLEEFLRQLGR